jgi:hypothetical protein
MKNQENIEFLDLLQQDMEKCQKSWKKGQRMKKMAKIDGNQENKQF